MARSFARLAAVCSGALLVSGGAALASEPRIRRIAATVAAACMLGGCLIAAQPASAATFCCNYAVDQFPNNTELLRLYGSHKTNGAIYLAGRGDY